MDMLFSRAGVVVVGTLLSMVTDVSPGNAMRLRKL